MKKENKLYKIMCERGITRYGIYKMTDYSWQTIDNIIKGRCRASEASAHVIATKLGLRLKDIFEPESNNK